MRSCWLIALVGCGHPVPAPPDAQAGTFLPDRLYPAGGAAIGLAVADLDGDGQLDVLGVDMTARDLELDPGSSLHVLLHRR